MTIKELKELARHSVRGTAPANFTCENVNAALADGLRELGNLNGSINEFQRNKLDIFDIIIENADEIVPKKVIDAIGRFAEVKVVKQGEKVLFKNRGLGRNRARKFLTQVGLSGVYETFRLDASEFTVETKSVGGAITMDFERFLDGAESLQELMEVLTEGLTDAVFYEVQKALVSAINASNRPAANKYIDSTFNAEEMSKLITVVRAYGEEVIIFATPEFVQAMGPDAIVPGSANFQGIYAQDDIDAIHRMGRIKMFRGVPIVEIPQSFVDNNNIQTWMNPQFAYILPAGKDRVVKVAIEGATQMYDFVNRDQSIEIHTYKKMGAAILSHYNWAIYQNTGIEDTSYNPYGF